MLKKEELHSIKGSKVAGGSPEMARTMGERKFYPDESLKGCGMESTSLKIAKEVNSITLSGADKEWRPDE
jgi:hypothetical protein